MLLNKLYCLITCTRASLDSNDVYTGILVGQTKIVCCKMPFRHSLFLFAFLGNFLFSDYVPDPVYSTALTINLRPLEISVYRII